MPKKKKSSTRAKGTTLTVRGRGTSTHTRSKSNSRTFVRFVLPTLIICALLGGLGFLAVSGYRTVTASGFFGLRNVDIRGNDRTSADDIRRIVTAAAEKPGVWNADLADIRLKLEKFPFVKSAAVSMVLPATIRVNITERVPAAVVHLSFGDYLVDGEGAILIAANPNTPEFPFVLKGWDETKTEKAIPDNAARLKLYKKVLDETKQFDLALRVKEVNLINPREPVAVVEDSGRAVNIILGKENLGKSLKTAMDVLKGKGAKLKSVNAEGVYPVLQYLDF
ncbi:hypothetical protein BH10ACI2_BH10ACI2_23280 [soil metagenome]